MRGVMECFKTQLQHDGIGLVLHVVMKQCVMGCVLSRTQSTASCYALPVDQLI
jgi:hypothetical protein